MTGLAGVGPVLEKGELAEAIVRAIREANAEVTVQDRGSYLRVLVPGRCVLPRATLERILGRRFSLPSDLERAMLSFTGAISFGGEGVVWTLGER